MSVLNSAPLVKLSGPNRWIMMMLEPIARIESRSD